MAAPKEPLGIGRPAWFARAACRGVGPDRFFAEPASGKSRLAKDICRGCPVTEACLAFGLEQRFGVWGGVDEDERLAMRRRVAS